MTKGQVYSIGNYLMTGKVLGKGYFARVEEATHRVLGKKVAIKVLDLTSIKEEYARRNVHREPRVLARLKHPCIAALYETMMHGPRLYVVLEAAGGGDLCAYVLAQRGPARGLSEARARGLAAQLVSAVRHMHARGVVHRDLKMENIMLDQTKQFIKIVDFGLSNVWSAGGGLHTPCGSLEYAAPELFLDGRRYGPEVDLWSIGVIVYGMVTGALPFTAPEGEGRARAQLRAAIAKGFTQKQRAALSAVTNGCKTFVQHLLEPDAAARMRIEEAARHRWVRRPGMRMRTHPLAPVEPRVNTEMYRHISELSGLSVVDVAGQIKADPYGPIGGMYNIKSHLHQVAAVPGADLLWTNCQEPRSCSPPEYNKRFDPAPPAPDPPRAHTAPGIASFRPPAKIEGNRLSVQRDTYLNTSTTPTPYKPRPPSLSLDTQKDKIITQKRDAVRQITKTLAANRIQAFPRAPVKPAPAAVRRHLSGVYAPETVCGDCVKRLPIIDEHSNALDVKARLRPAQPRRAEEPPRLGAPRADKRTDLRADFYRKAGDALPSWSSPATFPKPARLLLQSNATSIKRASLGNIASPNSSTNSHCKSEKSMPIGWYSTRSTKDLPHLQRFRRS